MRKPKKRTEEDLNYWQPTSDLMSGLVYILMLVIVLLGLYLMQIPEFDQPDPDLGDTYEGSLSPSPLTTDEWEDDDDERGGDGHDEGGGLTPYPTYFDFSPSPTPTITPNPRHGGPGGNGGGEGGGEGAGDGPGEDPDMGLKSAVYVMLVDAETELTVKEANVQFELYGENRSLQVLNVYYPERIAFRSYETTENGVFYFPEKLELGSYELHELTEPEGYDSSGNIDFELTETHDWSDPLVVRVPIYPSRNIIRVQMLDSETGVSISGGGFDVIAVENVVTADGTLRYRAGQIVSQIFCDDRGYGESEEIYLGEYILRQNTIPEYYASYTEDVTVTVEKKAAIAPAINSFPSERTRITFTLADELYPTRMISGAEFSVIPSKGLPFTATSDHLGRVRFEEITKSTSYRIRQTTTTGDYQLNTAEYTVNVNADGRIEGEATAEVNLTNRMIRVSVGVTDEFSNIQIPGVNLSLYSEEGELLHSWTTSGVAQNYTDLEPGQYYVVNTDSEQRYDITVRDQAEIQSVMIHSTYVMHYLLYAAVALVVVLVLVIVLIVILRRRKRKQASS